MGKLAVFFLFIFLAILSLLMFFNKGSVSLTVWKGVTYDDIPLVALIFISTAIGIISMFMVSLIRDTQRRMEIWQIQRIQKKQEKINDTYFKGLEAFLVSSYSVAQDMLAKVLEYDPANFNTLLRLGDIHSNQGDFGKAEEYYFKAKEVKPRSIEVLLSLERVAEIQQNWQEAIKYLDSILDIDSDNISILYKKRDIYERINKWEELMDVQLKILKCKLSEEEEKEENEKLLGYKYELGRYYIKEGSIDKALKILKSILKSDKNFTAAYLSLADAYVTEGNIKEVKAILMKGYEETSSLVFLVRLEDYYIKDGEPGSIIDIYQKAIQKSQKDVRLQFFLAKLYYRLEMIDYALDTINTLDPVVLDSPDMHALLGSVYERRSEHEKATEEFKKALNVDKPLMVPYCCSNCHFISLDWSGRCPECMNWNTLVLDINEICKIQKRQSST
jgi:tetratricopeptide (TPR) repeat protein